MLTKERDCPETPTLSLGDSVGSKQDRQRVTMRPVFFLLRGKNLSAVNVSMYVGWMNVGGSPAGYPLSMVCLSHFFRCRPLSSRRPCSGLHSPQPSCQRRGGSCPFFCAALFVYLGDMWRCAWPRSLVCSSNESAGSEDAASFGVF